MTAKERFDALTVIDGDCILWIGYTRNGYGRFKVDGKTLSAHRYAYEQVHGPIPQGLELDHLCKRTNCVRVEHLEAVTRRENILRSNALSARYLRNTCCPKGHPFDETNTYYRPSGSRECRICRQEYQRYRRIRY